MKFPKIELPRFERKPKEIDPPGVTVSAELVRGAKFASWVAYIALMYFLWERVLDVSEAQHSTLEISHFGVWSNLNLALFFPLVIGYIFVVIGVPYVAKIAIPILVSLTWHENFWPKFMALVQTILVSVVLITGTATVGSNAIIESERSAAVAVEEVQQNRVGIQSQIDRKERELQALINHRNTYFAIAASVSPEAYQANYIDARRGDPNIDRLRSALGASQDAARLREEIGNLEAERDAMQTTAAVSSEVVTARTQTLNGVMDFLNTFWVLLLAVVMDFACLFMPWIAMRLEQKRNRQLGLVNSVEASGWAPEGLRIEDLRAQEPIAKNTVQMETQVRATNNETGEEEILIKPKPYWRKAKRGQPTPVMVTPDIPDDETGVTIDGGNRIAVGADGLGGVMESEAPVENIPNAGEQVPSQDGDGEGQDNQEDQVAAEAHPEPSIEMSEEDLAVLYDLAPAAEQGIEQGDGDAEQYTQAHHDDEGEQEADHNEPQTNPARLLAAAE
jgi:hypothetical protein